MKRQVACVEVLRMYQLPHIVNCILKRAHDEGMPITQMKLQKLLYLLYADYLKNNNAVLFSERFEPWKYGPVLSDVYSAFSKFGSSPIRKYLIDSDGEYAMVSLSQNRDLKESLDRVWEKFSCYTGIELSKITHRPQGAWMKAVAQCSSVISDQDILHEVLA
jgi:uncharacterized phage-associated protein